MTASLPGWQRLDGYGRYRATVIRDGVERGCRHRHRTARAALACARRTIKGAEMAGRRAMRKQQTLWTCDRCGQNVVGAPGTRKAPDGWCDVQVVVPADGGVLSVVVGQVCGTCAAGLAEWWQKGQHR